LLIFFALMTENARETPKTGFFLLAYLPSKSKHFPQNLPFRSGKNALGTDRGRWVIFA